jgi:hypothetical protein
VEGGRQCLTLDTLPALAVVNKAMNFRDQDISCTAVKFPMGSGCKETTASSPILTTNRAVVHESSDCRTRKCCFGWASGEPACFPFASANKAVWGTNCLIDVVNFQSYWWTDDRGRGWLAEADSLATWLATSWMNYLSYVISQNTMICKFRVARTLRIYSKRI